MANTKSAIKRIRNSERKREHNRVMRGRMRTALKKARTLAAEGRSSESETAVKQAISELDKAAGKGVIHKNAAARRKSRLVKLLAK